MDTRRIGKLDVSVVGLGCNNFGGRIDDAATQRVVDAAIDAGVTLFDTADVYGGTRSEEFLGRSVGARRDQMQIATKFGGPIDDQRKGGASAAYIATAVDDSLKRLGTDRIDLYQLHFPDPSTPFDETLGALDELVRAGKVLEIGASNFSAEQIDETASISADRGLAAFKSVQNEYSLLRRGPERFGVLDACARNGLGFIPYFPLASGVLSGKYHRNAAPPEGTRLAGMPAERRDDALSDKVFDRVEALDAYARDHGHTLLELAIAWLLGASDRHERDRGRDEARAGARERGRSPVDAHGGEPARDRRRDRRRQRCLTYGSSPPASRHSRCWARCRAEPPAPLRPRPSPRCRSTCRATTSSTVTASAFSSAASTDRAPSTRAYRVGASSTVPTTWRPCGRSRAGTPTRCGCR